VCFAQNRVTLTGIGRTVFLITLLIIVLAGIELLLIKPVSTQSDNIKGGKETLDAFLAAATFSMNSALVYFGLLTGLSINRPEG
jgi:hypothetical protein